MIFTTFYFANLEYRIYETGQYVVLFDRSLDHYMHEKSPVDELVALTKWYTGCHKYVPIDQRLNFRAHRGYNLKRSTARCAKIKELDLATFGTQTASIFTLRFTKNA